MDTGCELIGPTVREGATLLDRIDGAVNELAEASGVAMVVDEAMVPVFPPVRAPCEMLGLDPLYVANEGVAVAIVAPDDAERVPDAAQSRVEGAHAAVIGAVEEGLPRVAARTGLGVTRR